MDGAYAVACSYAKRELAGPLLGSIDQRFCNFPVTLFARWTYFGPIRLLTTEQTVTYTLSLRVCA
jgi:hypothetical protein